MLPSEQTLPQARRPDFIFLLTDTLKFHTPRTICLLITNRLCTRTDRPVYRSLC